MSQDPEQLDLLESSQLLAQMPIGLFDSGLGGLSVLSGLLDELPSENYVYLGDTARTPYGSKGRSTVINYARECARFLQSQKVKLMIVACNTASALAVEVLRGEVDCPLIGTIDPAVEEALQTTRNGTIGVIGTSATISSGVYERSLLEKDSSLKVFSKACPLFVPLVEEGIFEGRIVESVVEMYLGELKQRNIDTLLLGCTHYPYLKKCLQSFWGPELRIIECSHAIAKRARKLLEAKGLMSVNKEGLESYFVTDELSRFSYLASLVLEKGAQRVSRVDLQSLDVAAKH